MRCPRCNFNLSDLKEEIDKDQISREDYFKILRWRRDKLRDVYKYMRIPSKDFRNHINHASFEDPMFQLMVAIEGMFDFLRKDVNLELKRVGLTEIPGKIKDENLPA